MKISKGIIYTKSFLKQYKALVNTYPNLKNKIAQRVELFTQKRDSEILRDHKLLGSMNNLRSFSITGDIRIIYEEDDEYITFRLIGTHNQVY